MHSVILILFNFFLFLKEIDWGYNTTYYVNRCPGKITTVETDVIAKTDHSHAGDAPKIEKRISSNKMKEKALEANSPPRRIIRTVTSTMTTETAVGLPKYESLSRNLRRIRQKANTTPKLTQTLSELVIDGEFAKTLKGEKIVLYDNYDETNRIVIFTTKENLQFLVHCEDRYMDGTFSITPPLFSQVYTQVIHFTSVCRSKKISTFSIGRRSSLQEGFLYLRNNCFAIEVSRTEIRSPKIQALGLQILYQDDPRFASYIRCGFVYQMCCSYSLRAY